MNGTLCRTCGVQGVGTCEKCGLAYYCSRECQTKDWVEGDHRKECDVFARLYAFLKSSEHAAKQAVLKSAEHAAKQAAEKQAAEKQAANPAPDKDVRHVEALRAFTRVKDQWKSGARGYCRDCRYTTGLLEVTSHLCNGCTKARICNACEFKFQICRDCREAHVSRRVPGADGNGNN